MTSFSEYLTQGTRIFLSSWKNRIYSKKYKGSAKEICERVVKECWNGRYFQTSTGNFPQFWTRDFGWCVSSLMKLGYEKEVHQTLRYAINRFQKTNRVTTTITPKGKPFNFPLQSVDSLPWLIHSIKVSKFPYYSYKSFLNEQIKEFQEEFVDDKGLVKEKHFSSIKDFAIRKSSCYDNCMAAMLSKDLEHMKLENPFKKFDYPILIKDNFWNDKYFYDDLDKKEYVAGDANIFLFVLGIIQDKEMLKSTISHIEEEKLDQPFPLKYTKSRENIRFIWQEIFLKNYESNAIWMHMGPLYLKLLQTINMQKAKEIKEKYTQLIEKHNNFLEVFNDKGKPFRTPFYYCDRGMLWAANYLTL